MIHAAIYAVYSVPDYFDFGLCSVSLLSGCDGCSAFRVSL